MKAVLSRLRWLARQVVGTFFEAAGGPLPGLVAGAGSRYDDRPVAVVLLLGQDGGVVADTAARLAQALRDGGPRSVLVLDGPHFAQARRAGIACDHVLSRAAYAERVPEGSWEDYLRAQTARLRRDYRTRCVVRLPDGGAAALPAGGLPELLAQAQRQRPARHRGRYGRALVRLERRLDRPS